ncbi:SRPBCC family protein [Micromonospora auratinigra]|uniref:Polyketide cyclase / dehydrase and lipid transport n=1 Tax=Micromonospora auratinigra TaxID=261654 RepID=A0A1A8ZRI1_9ACTN|nr:SRPBCC family protein [Micromonospora auratinigra]SBT46470.1 Polyketide cyclase / dehydrase and lipid transport [Micromonospora auratinigra]
MATHAERGMSAPPEVVFNTATDPDRAAAWLPESLRREGTQQRVEVVDADDMRARWTSDGDGWAADIDVEPADAGGARVTLDLSGPDHGLADEILANLAREVADNLTAG